MYVKISLLLIQGLYAIHAGLNLRLKGPKKGLKCLKVGKVVLIGEIAF
jgi:hypothetical protein